MTRHNTFSLRLSWLAALLATSSAVSLPPSVIFQRANTCGDPTYNRCPQAGFPDNFCCSPGSTCIPLAGNTTVLCCPPNGPNDCNIIAPITCDLSQENPATYPHAEIKTTALDGKLPVCGANCCPYGYVCNEQGNCEKEEDQSKPPSGSGSSGSSKTTSAATHATTGTTMTAASVASPTGSSHASTGTKGGTSSTDTPTQAAETSSASAPSNVAHSSSGSGSSNSATVGGVVGAVIGSVAIAGFVVFCIRRRKAKDSRDSTASFGNLHGKISAPMPNKEYPYGRTDFALGKGIGGSSAGSTPESNDRATFERFMGRPFSTSSVDSPSANVSPRSHHQSAMIPPIRNLTGSRDRHTRGQSQGSQNIDIYADAQTVGSGATRGRRDTTLTTFSTFLKRARET